MHGVTNARSPNDTDRRLLRLLLVGIVGAIVAAVILNVVAIGGTLGFVLEFLIAFVVFMGLILLVDRERSARRRRG